MGLRGLALGTVVGAYLLVIGGLLLPGAFAKGVRYRGVGRLALLVTIFSALAIGASELVPWRMGTIVTLFARVSLFTVIYLLALFRFPDRELRSISDEIAWNFRNTVFPGKWRTGKDGPEGDDPSNA